MRESEYRVDAFPGRGRTEMQGALAPCVRPRWLKCLAAEAPHVTLNELHHECGSVDFRVSEAWEDSDGSPALVRVEAQCARCGLVLVLARVLESLPCEARKGLACAQCEGLLFGVGVAFEYPSYVSATGDPPVDWSNEDWVSDDAPSWTWVLGDCRNCGRISIISELEGD
jgi:hypothetical protein